MISDLSAPSHSKTKIPFNIFDVDQCAESDPVVGIMGATLHLRRAKGGSVTTNPVLGDELRSLRTLKREAKSPFIFVSERGAPFSAAL